MTIGQGGGDQRGLGRRSILRRIRVKSKGSLVVVGFFTWNSRRRKFERWGHSYIESSHRVAPGVGIGRQRLFDLVLGTTGDYEAATGDPDFSWNAWAAAAAAAAEGSAPPAGGRPPTVGGPGGPPTDQGVGIPPPIFGDYDLGPSTDTTEFDRSLSLMTHAYPSPPTPDYPWWMPDGFRLFRTTQPGDDPTDGSTHGNPDPGFHNLGWHQEGPFVGPFYNLNDVGTDQVFLGVAFPDDFDGSPYDIAGTLRYRHYGNLYGTWRPWVGGGLYFQWTNDELAGGQSNPDTQDSGAWATHGDQHALGYFDVGVEWDLGPQGGVLSDVDVEFTLEVDFAGRVNPAFGISWSPGGP